MSETNLSKRIIPHCYSHFADIQAVDSTLAEPFEVGPYTLADASPAAAYKLIDMVDKVVEAEERKVEEEVDIVEPPLADSDVMKSLRHSDTRREVNKVVRHQ